MNDVLSACILGAVQGLTEFLPVSSSGHLVVLQSVLPVVGDPVAFDLALHLGTLLPVVVVYRADLGRIARDAVAGEGPWWRRRGVRLGWLVGLGSVPTAAIGLAFESRFETLFGNPGAVAWAFLLTGAILLATRFIPRGDRDEASTEGWRAVAVGVAQGLAITPGVSRSGSTIAAGLLLGMDREFAARFSFLLSLPAILGAFALRASHVSLGGDAWMPLLAGFSSSALVGYAALRLLLRVVRAGSFAWFSVYLWLMAGVAFWMAGHGVG